MTAYEPPEAAVEAGARAIREYPGVVYARADVAVPQVSKAVLTAAAPHLHRVFLDELIAERDA